MFENLIDSGNSLSENLVDSGNSMSENFVDSGISVSEIPEKWREREIGR